MAGRDRCMLVVAGGGRGISPTQQQAPRPPAPRTQPLCLYVRAGVRLAGQVQIDHLAVVLKHAPDLVSHLRQFQSSPAPGRQRRRRNSTPFSSVVVSHDDRREHRDDAC